MNPENAKKLESPAIELEPPEDLEIIFKDKVLGYDYSILGEKRETIERWKKEVEEVIQEVKEAVKNKDIEVIKKITEASADRFNFKEINTILQDEKNPLDESTIIMWAIGLWIVKRQPKWPGFAAIHKKLSDQNPHRLADIIDKEGGIPSCIDSANLTEVMAKEFGLTGEIKTKQMVHRYWENKDGIMIDTWWGEHTGGLFRRWVKDDMKKWTNPAIPCHIPCEVCGS